MYRNNELIIICKVCGKEKRVRSKRDIHLNGNFCNQECFKKWAKENLSISKKEKMKAQVETNKRWRHRSEKYLINQIRKRARKEHKDNKRLRKWQERLTKRTYICSQCNKVFEAEWYSDRKNRYCSRKCQAESQKIYKTPEQVRAYRRKYKRSGNGGISRMAFEKIKAKYNYCCVLCGRREPFLNQYWPHLVQDHIIPRSLNGKQRSSSNIQPLCWNCNTVKSNKLL